MPSKIKSKPESIKTGNISKVSRLKFKAPLYDLHIEFKLDFDQEIQEPEDWIKNMKKKNSSSIRSVNALFCGSGYSFLTGNRDLHFQGTEKQMQEIATAFAHSPFRIAKIQAFPAEEMWDII